MIYVGFVYIARLLQHFPPTRPLPCIHPGASFVGLGRCLKQLTLTACGVGGDLELMPCGVAAIYDKCTTTLKDWVRVKKPPW